MKGYGSPSSHDPSLPPIANPFDSLDSLLPPKPPPETTS
jgi:hypothetical protein